MIYLFTTDRQTVNYYSTIHTLELTYFHSNTQETMKKQLYPSDSFNFPPLHGRSPAEAKRTLHRLTSRRHGRWEGWRHKTAPNTVTHFRPVKCTIVYHWLYKRDVLEYYVKSPTIWGFGCHGNINLAYFATFAFCISETDVSYLDLVGIVCTQL